MNLMPPTESQVLDALRQVMDPDLHRDIVTLGFVKDMVIESVDENTLTPGPPHEGRGGIRVSFKIELTTPACPVKDLLQEQARSVVLALPGVEEVEAEMTARVVARSIPKDDLLPGVKHCIAIASGKGGVGKSTVTVNLAVALAKQGATVGILDADVYGPSIPMMMGCFDRPFTKAEKIVPLERFGVKLMSLGFLLEEGQAVLWRGPMVAGTVKQLLEDVDWGELDYLLVDLPPGTGDAPMSLAQLAPLTGVVIVTTPHHVAANIAGKSVQLFERLNAPILGVVENMAGFACPHCGETTEIFAGLTGKELAERFGVAYLGSIPLDPYVSEDSDRGVPSVEAHPERAQAQAFSAISRQLAAQVSISAMEVKQNEPAGVP
jgi:ATP-binding protein involved in chromosome partitioning